MLRTTVRAVFMLFIGLPVAATNVSTQGPSSLSALDQQAFGAFADQQLEKLAALKAMGADATRYARTNPKALFDAISEKRAVAVLEFVLSAEPDPESVRTALRSTTGSLDLDKMRLLLEHGADVNVREVHSHYTLLATVLFRQRPIELPAVTAWKQPARTYEKVSLVQLLLDHHVDINGDHSGWGKWGALGHTRADDTEVIDLLLRNGATLTDTMLGPVRVAAVADRRDLALGLIRRDRAIQPLDKLAVLDATRRGWADVVQELLRAGADSNIAADDGATPLMIANYRRDEHLVGMLTAAGAIPNGKPMKRDYRAAGLDDFSTTAAAAIDYAALFDPPRFSLSWSVASQPKPVGFGFFGNDLDSVDEVRCERSAAFHVIAHANRAAQVHVGVCRQAKKRIRQSLKATEKLVQSFLARRASADPNRPDWQIASLDWTYAKRAGPDRSERHVFNLIVIGHGILSFPTLVVLPRDGSRAVIVQLDNNNLCHRFKIETPLCSAPYESLSTIADHVMQRF